MLGTKLPHVAHDADDGSPGDPIRTAESNPAANWICTGPIRARSRFINDGDGRRAGVVATAAQARTRELGIRIALGAQRGEVFRLVLAGGVTLAVLGVALGSAGAFWFAQGVRGLLVGVEPGDPLVFALTGGLLSAAALLATWLPARRAARTDPMIALRAE